MTDLSDLTEDEFNTILNYVCPMETSQPNPSSVEKSSFNAILTFARHGEPDESKFDPDLTEAGLAAAEEQADDTTLSIRNHSMTAPTLILQSPSLRCVRSARILGAAITAGLIERQRRKLGRELTEEEMSQCSVPKVTLSRLRERAGRRSKIDWQKPGGTIEGDSLIIDRSLSEKEDTDGVLKSRARAGKKDISTILRGVHARRGERTQLIEALLLGYSIYGKFLIEETTGRIQPRILNYEERQSFEVTITDDDEMVFVRYRHENDY